MSKVYVERDAVRDMLHREIESWGSQTDEINALLGANDRLFEIPAADVVEGSAIKAYLQSKLDEWYALGDRRFEPENVWGYNFIRACFDDLDEMDEMDGGADNG